MKDIDTISGTKFIRRKDLTPLVRLEIAYKALMAITYGLWGTITELSREHDVSRTFIYSLASVLLESSTNIFSGAISKLNPNIKRVLLTYILALRLEGRCSNLSISILLKRFECENNSVGYVSQILNIIGSLLPSTLKNEGENIQFVIFASDEIFSNGKPILVTVDPISSAILLRIELVDKRTAEAWKHHWNCIEDDGYIALYLVCDGGTALEKAHKESLSDAIKQPDTYHAVAHILGLLDKRLEQAAYKAIEKEYKMNETIGENITEEVLNKKILRYEEAVKEAKERIEEYETFHYLYISIIKELELFDKDGNLKDKEEVTQNITAALDLLEEMGKNSVIQNVKKIRRNLPDMLNYFDIAQSVITKISKTIPIDQEILRCLFIAWQFRKNRIKSKCTRRKKYYAENEETMLDIVSEVIGEEYESIKDNIFNELSTIVQSSSLVECINSILRPYLNCSKNQITQETLNLIMFYHNHRRYIDGIRTGKTPKELLTGKKQDKDWIELLLEIIEVESPGILS
ncbi:MAG: hypothetical protein OMM_03634 [Candidatus Magnetoglobus multicellularis str. Araruama]|uniref:Uncharacterized protein n=1 Tax=Candidatus Magnetoglobus multicellularis str. Araruama TaxID=890399 RepID=A0A1V1P4V0_9BACT|nr:MAG: hypothetical protein OMM_03634 [Candidatus Magnetoglobus multicellularis str. Araruama]